jgi:U3 small nucleolar RNA-associated protein 6
VHTSPRGVANTALPRVTLFRAVQNVLVTHPSPEGLKRALFAHLHAHLRSALPCDPHALVLLAERHLAALSPEAAGGPDGEAFVDGLRRAHDELRDAVARTAGKDDDGTSDTITADGIARVYVSFVRDWCAEEKDLDPNLVSLNCSFHFFSCPVCKEKKKANLCWGFSNLLLLLGWS